MHRQQKLSLLTEMSKPRMFADAELRMCKSYEDALWETIKRSGRKRKVIEADTGITTSTMSRILSGTREFPRGKKRLFFEVCGNLFAQQWENYHDYGLRCERRELTTDEKAELFDQMQVAELEQRVSA